MAEQTPAATLVAWRMQAGLMEQKDAATKMSCSRTWLCRIETGAARPGMKALRKLAAVYGVQVTEDQIRDLYARFQRPQAPSDREWVLLNAVRSMDYERAVRLVNTMTRPVAA